MLNTESNQIDNSRRSFLKKLALGTATIATGGFGLFSAAPLAGNVVNEEEVPWYKRVTRWSQINIRENDPPQMDISWWRKYWKQTETEGVVLNAGGIVAYYPSRIPLHHKAEFLHGRDLFGDLSSAAHEDGLAVFARMDSSMAHEDFYQAHPSWFARDASGKPYKRGDLYYTCINSPYYEEYIPSVMEEIIEMYHPEGFTDNHWTGLGRDSICYCEYCKKSFYDKTGNDIPRVKNWDDPVYRKWIRWSYDRRLEIWDLNNRVTKSAGGPQCIWAGMNSGSISGQSRSFRDSKEICKRADIMMIDDQGRSGSGFQENGDIGKQIHGLLGWDKLIPESMAMYQRRPTFRVASASEPEAKMWMLDGFAGGIQPWWHMVGAYHEDRRMYNTPRPILAWYKKNEEFLVNRRPIANIGVVWSQQNVDFYGQDNAHELVDLPWQGITEALIQANIPYLPVHADHIDRDADQFSLLVLPNLAVMSDSQIDSVRRFVERGGSLIATGKSSLFNERGDRRADYGLSNLFSTHVAKSQNANVGAHIPKLGGDHYHTYLRLTPELRRQTEGPHNDKEPPITGEKRNDVLKGFEDTDILPYGGLLKALQTDENVEVPMTFVPQFPMYPPETAYMREPKTDIPGLVLNKKPHGSRIAFLPADLDRLFARFNLPDHGRLLANLIRWTVKDEIPITIEGTGLVDSHLYHQSDHLILHIVNLTSAGTSRSTVHELISIGPLRIRVKLPDDVNGKRLRLLVSNQNISAKVQNGWCNFEVKSVIDHEVVIIT